MKGKEAIAKTTQRLELEFEQRKQQRLAGMNRHKEDLEIKIQKLQSEINTLNSKISEIESSSFRATHLSEESRRAQSQAAKQSRIIS